MKKFYESDCKKIAVAFEEKGLFITIEQAYNFWSERSETMAAGWLGLPDDNEHLFEEIMSYSTSAKNVEEEQILTDLQKFLDERVAPENQKKARSIVYQLRKLI